MFFKTKDNAHEESHWLTVSDLMAGLMMVFLFIAIALMRSALLDKEKIVEIAVTYQENQVAIYKELLNEFEKDLDVWDAEIDEQSLTFTFRSPDILFDIGKIELKENYKALLDDFFPRYMGVLENYKHSISEVRIEGHTSSDWNSLPRDEAYFMNMTLSQGRTRSVLSYIYQIPSVIKSKDWIRSTFSAVGFSSSRLIFKDGVGGEEDMVRSRRVTFRVITDADIQLRKILEVD